MLSPRSVRSLLTSSLLRCSLGRALGSAGTALATLATGSALLLSAGCVEEVDLIDRTQVNYLEKARLHGVWYEVDVVTDIPIAANFGFTGQTNFAGEEGGKVIFDIQENHLVVYPYSSKIVGVDPKYQKRKIRTYWREGKEDEFIELALGNPVAIYPITSHFDRIRDYATTTGEQSNVLVENTTDNPWWKRKYMRVDWARNSVQNLLFPQGSMTFSPVDYFVPEEERDNPNKFYFSPESDYFHFTRRLYGQPMSTGACSPYSIAPGDCSGAVFEVRIAFRRADVARVNDHEVRRYPNRTEQDKFGFFLSERYRFDEEYGITFSGKDSKAAVWNIWQKSRTFAAQKDAGGNDVPCIANSDCEAPALCVQKDWFEPGVCSTGSRIPYRERGVRPIVYHASADHPKNHLVAAYGAADSWDDVFKETVSWLYFWEEKWAKDGVQPFSGGNSRFGQRLCSSNADCEGVAAAAAEVPVQPLANRVVAFAKDGAGKVVSTVVEDCVQDGLAGCKDRAKLTDNALVVLVNASPGTTASLTGVPGGDITGVGFVPYSKDGQRTPVVAANQGRFVPKADFGTYNLQISADGKIIEVPNVKLAATDVVMVFLVGGDAAVVARSKGNNKAGLRVVNGLGGGAPSSGLTYDVGVSGTRLANGLAYGTVTDFLYTEGQLGHVTLVEPGHRADVSCGTISGVSQCVGWKQELTDADRQRRLEIKASLPRTFVLCENVHRPISQCNADEIGNPKSMTDCRYWGKDAKGKDWNPCMDRDDGGLVAHAGEHKILGDIRYNYMYWVPNANAASPLGYGPSAADPDTGELVWATAHMYGAAHTTYAQYGKDLVDLLNGDLDPKSVTSGKYVRDYILQASQSGKDKGLFGAVADQLPVGEADQRATFRLRDAYVDQLPAGNPTAPIGRVDEATARQVAELQKPAALNTWLTQNLPAYDVTVAQARLEKIAGTPLERAMVNDEVALVFSEGQLQPGQAISPEMMAKISPVGWATHKGSWSERQRVQFLGIHSITPAEFQDPSLIGLARRLKCDPGETPVEDPAMVEANLSGQVCWKGDALRTALSVALYKGVMEHEVGHTVGLRHNFEGSADVLNYFDGYFDPETGREKEEVICGDLVTPAGIISGDEMCENQTLGETCVPRICSASNPCPAGLACKSGQCLDADNLQVGTCQGSELLLPTCESDAECGDGLCKSGRCHDKIACQTDATCQDAEACISGFCADVRTQAPRTKPTVALAKPAIAKKYVSRPYLTDKEQANRRAEYQYSTIMDYGQRVNSDIHGLGKYDYAAIKYGYGELLEVYADTTYLRAQTERYANNINYPIEQVAWRMDTGDWKFAGAVTPAFNYLNDWLPPTYNQQRDVVPEHFVGSEARFADNYFRGSADKTYFEVPYKYCSDEYRGNLNCYYYDQGGTTEEVVAHSAEAMREYYLFDAFKRERQWYGRGGSPAGYLARMQDRWLLPIEQAGRYYAIYNNIYRSQTWFAAFERTESGMSVLRRAAERSFRELAGLIAAPAPGSYGFDPLRNAYTNLSYEAGAAGADFSLDLGAAKFPWTTFATQKGYYYYDHPQWIGGYWDKVGAIVSMTNSTFQSAAEYVGEQLPVFRATAIGFNTVYPDALARVLGGLVAGDMEQFAGLYDAAGGYRPADPFRLAGGEQKRVQPSILNHSLRIFAAWQAIANLPAGFDPSYTDAMAVWLKGNGNQYDLSGGQIGSGNVAIEACEFADPFGKKSYVAPRPNYSKVRYSPAYAMCRKLNTWATGCADGSTCQAGKCADATTCSTAPNLQTATGADKDRLIGDMKNEIEVLDYLRQLYAIYGAIGAGAI